MIVALGNGACVGGGARINEEPGVDSVLPMRSIKAIESNKVINPKECPVKIAMSSDSCRADRAGKRSKVTK